MRWRAIVYLCYLRDLFGVWSVTDDSVTNILFLFLSPREWWIQRRYCRLWTDATILPSIELFRSSWESRRHFFFYFSNKNRSVVQMQLFRLIGGHMPPLFTHFSCPWIKSNKKRNFVSTYIKQKWTQIQCKQNSLRC